MPPWESTKRAAVLVGYPFFSFTWGFHHPPRGSAGTEGFWQCRPFGETFWGWGAAVTPALGNRNNRNAFTGFSPEGRERVFLPSSCSLFSSARPIGVASLTTDIRDPCAPQAAAAAGGRGGRTTAPPGWGFGGWERFIRFPGCFWRRQELELEHPKLLFSRTAALFLWGGSAASTVCL